MKILIPMPYCSQEVYEKIIPEVKNRVDQQFRRYIRLLTLGLAAGGCEVTVACSFAVNPEICKMKVISFLDEKVDKVQFHYFKTFNYRCLNRIMKYLQNLFYTYSFCTKNKDAVVLCDPNTVSVCKGAILGAKWAGAKVVQVLSDVPTVHIGSMNKKLTRRQRSANKMLQDADGYIFFTQAMNSLINLKNKPYIISEGMVDSEAQYGENTLTGKYPKRVMMYTGGIVKAYGLNELVEAFALANVDNTELHIYGGGSYSEEFRKKCSEYKNVKYLGVMNNNRIVEEQRRATVLVNPRLTDYEYTKYSFPSKNMEYMSSGTPVLTTKLPGMPEEYNNYVYLFQNETVEGMASAIKDVFGNTDIELNYFGNRAKQWIVSSKNNITAAAEILRLIDEVFRR